MHNWFVAFACIASAYFLLQHPDMFGSIVQQPPSTHYKDKWSGREFTYSTERVQVAEEVERSLTSNPLLLLSLDSSLLCHSGIPYPENVRVMKEVEAAVREQGAIPATIAILHGKLQIGLSDEQMDELGKLGPNAYKTSRRDIAYVMANGLSGATTVAATMYIANKVGISLLAASGIGGVSKVVEYDISADLDELGKTPTTVVCSGALPSIVDIPLTLEHLETLGVNVVTYNTDYFPGRFLESSGYKGNVRADNIEQIGSLVIASKEIDLQVGIIVAVPLPTYHSSFSHLRLATHFEHAAKLAKEQKISGKKLSPYLLTKVNELSKGESVKAEIALFKNNAKIAAQIAVSLANHF